MAESRIEKGVMKRINSGFYIHRTDDKTDTVCLDLNFETVDRSRQATFFRFVLLFLTFIFVLSSFFDIILHFLVEIRCTISIYFGNCKSY
jgi:hypothetical protein